MKKLIQLLLLMLFVYVGYAGYSVWTFTGDDYDKETDAAIVLGAAAYHDKPSPVFKERINHAIKLYHEGKVNHLIFTGGNGEGAHYAESEVAKMYAIRNGVPEKDISLETSSKITEQNLDEAKRVGEKEGFQSYRLVSDPLHTKRAMAMGEDRDMEVYASPTKTSAYQSLETRVPFFLREWLFYVGYEVTVIGKQILRLVNVKDAVEL